MGLIVGWGGGDSVEGNEEFGTVVEGSGRVLLEGCSQVCCWGFDKWFESDGDNWHLVITYFLFFLPPQQDE